MDILDLKLEQYEISDKKNINFEYMTIDYEDISKIISGDESVKDLILKVKNYLNINGNPFSMDTISFIYLKKANKTKDEIVDLMNEIDYYFPIDKQKILLLLQGVKKAQLKDKRSQIQECKNILPKAKKFQVFDTVIEDFLIEITYDNLMNEIDFFNQIETGNDMPMVMYQTKKKSLCKIYTIYENEIKPPTKSLTADDEEPKDEVVTKYFYTPIKSSGSRSKKLASHVVFDQEARRIILSIPYVFIKEKSSFVQGVVRHFHKIENPQARDSGLIASFIVKWGFNRYYLLDLIFSTPELNSLIYMDESTLFSKKKSFNLNFVLQTTREAEKVLVSISQYEPEDYVNEIIDEDADYTYVKIKNARNEKQVEMFKEMLLKLFTLYDKKKDEIEQYYVENGVDYKVKPKKKKKKEKEGKLDRVMYPPKSARVVQGFAKPVLVARARLGDKESEEAAVKKIKQAEKEGYIVVKWPTIVVGHEDKTEKLANRKVVTYYRGSGKVKDDDDSGPGYIHPGLVPNPDKDTNEDVPFFLTFYKKSTKLEINRDWSVKIIGTHRSPKSSIPVLVNAEILFKPHEISYQDFSPNQEKQENFYNLTILYALCDALQVKKKVSSVLKDMIDQTRPELLKQQFWNYTLPEIQTQLALLKEGKIVLDYQFFVRMLEEYFDINLFAFTFDTHDLYMTIPHYKQLYVYEEKVRRSICLITTEVKPNIPYYKVILLDDEPIMSEKIRTRIFNLRKSIVNYVCNPIYFDPEWAMTGQVLDMYGKARIIQFEKDNQMSQILLPRPMEPFNVKEVKARKSKVEYSLPFPTYTPSKKDDFNVRKRIANIIKEFGKLLFFFNPKIDNHFVIDTPNFPTEIEARTDLTYMRSQDDVVDFFVEKFPFLFKDRKLVVENDTILRGINDYVRANRYVEFPKYMVDLCSDISDFTCYNPYEVVFTQVDAIQSMTMTNMFYTEKEYSPKKEPYFVRDNFGRIYLFQNVLFGEYKIALRVLSQWNLNKINTGYYSYPLDTDYDVEVLNYENGIILPDEAGIAKIGTNFFFFAPLTQ